MHHPPLTIGQCTALACLLEATAPKPGNVHRGADFEDLTYTDLVAAGIAIAPEMDLASERSLGQTIFHAISATKRLVKTNANLGIVLLIAPLASVRRIDSLTAGVRSVIDSLTADDAQLVYQAIQLAQPGGLGKVEKADLAEPPPSDLVEAMKLASERDLVARQYVNGFQEVLQVVVPHLQAGMQRGWSINDTIVHVHLQMMSQYPDSLIARKCGLSVAQQAADHAAEILASGAPDDEAYHQGLADLDFWLRSDGHRRNPGTTADLVAAGLFALLRDGQLKI